MRIVYHLGAHCTDEERLLRCLLRNRSTLADQGIEVPGPARYRNLLHETARQLRGASADRDTQSMLMDQKLGKRVADECSSPAQVAVAEALKKNPAPSLLDAPAAAK